MSSFTPFAVEQPSTQQQAQSSQVTFAPEPPKMDSAGSSSYKLTASPSGMNLFVEADEYDPLAPHRKHNEDTDKGEGMSFMFTLFSCCSPAVKKFPEPAATSDRHYSLPPSESMLNLCENKVQ